MVYIILSKFVYTQNILDDLSASFVRSFLKAAKSILEVKYEFSLFSHFISSFSFFISYFVSLSLNLLIESCISLILQSKVSSLILINSQFRYSFKNACVFNSKIRFLSLSSFSISTIKNNH